MTPSVICTIAVGLIALWQVERARHWHMVSRILVRDIAVERAKRKALAMALGDLQTGLQRCDADLCAKAMVAARRVAEDDSEETLVKLGFKLPDRIGGGR